MLGGKRKPAKEWCFSKELIKAVVQFLIIEIKKVESNDLLQMENWILKMLSEI